MISLPKVLFITRTYPPARGGMQKASFALTQRYSGEKKILALRKKHARLHLLWFFPYAASMLVVCARQYDVVHLADGALCGLGWIARVICKKPVILTLHGLDMTYPFFLYQWYLQAMGSGFLQYVCVSKAAQKEAERHGWNPITVIPNGVDERYYSLVSSKDMIQEIYKIPSGACILLTVGRLVKRKGVAWFVEQVFPRLADSFWYAIVGDGPERNRIRAIIRAKGLTERVLVTGEVSEQELLSWYQAADIFVMPNRNIPGDIEGFGIVAIEASAAGIPVIASRIEGIPDAVQDGKNGILARAEDHGAFVRAITFYGERPEERKKMGDAARLWVAEKYRWSAVIKQYELLFTQQRYVS